MIPALLAVLFALPGVAGEPARDLRSLSNDHRLNPYDGARGRRDLAVAAPAGPDVFPSQVQERLRQTKALLSHGTESPNGLVDPFYFRPRDAKPVAARSAGLEGFVYAESELSRDHGAGALAHQLPDYFNYLDALLSPVSWAKDARERIRGIRDGSADADEKYRRLMSFVRDYSESLRRQVAASDGSAWARKARIYEVFARAYNVKGLRAAQGAPEPAAGRFFADFRTQDLRRIRDMGFDAVWILGINPRGARGAKGTAGGSPFAIQDSERVDPALGTEEDFKGFVGRAHRLGLKVLIDFVPNHTAMDSRLLAEHPDFFLTEPGRPEPPPEGFFPHHDVARNRWLWVRHGGYDQDGRLSFWTDTAQLDVRNPALRREFIRILSRWAGEFCVDGFRVDVAYQTLNSYFSRNWRLPMPAREFAEEIITEVKARHPGTAFIAEGYDSWDELSRAGFDMNQNRNNMVRRGGSDHAGWYDALAARNPGWIREAIRRAAYLHWEQGGMDGMMYVGNHDEKTPRRAFGDWMEGASFLTLLLPNAMMFYGAQEIGADLTGPGDELKAIPFETPAQVDWSAGEPRAKAFHEETFRLARDLRRTLQPAGLEALPRQGWPNWVGYLLQGCGRPQCGKAAAVLANPTHEAVRVQFALPELAIAYDDTLPPLGYRLVRF
ncbi:MAG: hypothetical protein HY554_03855 [Elusimicrobia bacterium]|nr:hypothetical protein [Elusimicrobiota bacterium]